MRSGVMVAGHTTGEAEMVDTGLITGDTIHALNGKPVTSVTELRALLNTFKSGSPVVLRIERNSRVMFLSFELD
jgi:S1-C subfamily serine protease